MKDHLPSTCFSFVCLFVWHDIFSAKKAERERGEARQKEAATRFLCFLKLKKNITVILHSENKTKFEIDV